MPPQRPPDLAESPAACTPSCCLPSPPPRQSSQDQHDCQGSWSGTHPVLCSSCLAGTLYLLLTMYRVKFHLCACWWTSSFHPPATSSFTQPTAEGSGHGPAPTAGCRGRGDEQVGPCLPGRPSVLYVVLKKIVVVWIRATEQSLHTFLLNVDV